MDYGRVLDLGITAKRKDEVRGQLPEYLQNTRIPWGPIGEQVYRRTYSQKKPNGQNETWGDTVVRAVDGNLALVDEKFIEPGEREKLYELLYLMNGLPAGRHLNASGMKGRQFLFNCHASGWDPLEPSAHFTFLFDALMQGGGVGSNYSNRYLESMPVVQNDVRIRLICRDDHPDLKEFEHLLSKEDQDPSVFTEQVWQEAEQKFVKAAPTNHFKTMPIHRVEDSREGWVEAIKYIIEYAYDARNAHTDLVIDLSVVRCRGTPLKTGGGIACGPGPLAMTLSEVNSHLSACVGRKLSSLDAMNIDHSLSACVVAGGKRRSSRMAVKNWKDSDIFEFIECKKVDGSHWTTNISVEVDDEFQEAYAAGNVHALLVMKMVVRGSRKNGEPGIWNRSLAMKGERHPERMYCPNPCGEIGLYMWENCNLGHINLGAMARKPVREIEEAFRLMARWLIRATFGDVPNPRQRAVLDENRRIGVGFFGFHEWIALNGIKYSECWNNDFVIGRLQRYKAVVDKECVAYATQMSIPIPVKNSTLAPTGTIVTLPGTTGSGQCLKQRRGKRLVRYSSMDPELAVQKLKGYEVIVDDDALNTEIVVYWYEDPLVAKVRAAGWDPDTVLEDENQIPFDTSLAIQAMFQDVWADNAISFTINLDEKLMPSEEEMEAALAKHLPRLKGTTVFPPISRKNAPFQSVTKEQWDAYTGPKEISFIEDECKGGCPVG